MDVRHLDRILGFSWTCLCISTMCNVCLQTVKIRNTYLNYLFRIRWSLIKCVALWKDPLLPPARPGQWFRGMVPPPPSWGRSYTWYTHLPNHTLGKHEIRPRQIWPVSPHFVCTSGSFFDFGFQTSVPGRDWMCTKGLNPSFSTHCPHGSIWTPPSDTMLFHLVECSCLCDVNNFNYLWIKNPFFRQISRTSAKSSDFY